MRAHLQVANAPYSSDVEKNIFSRGLGTDVAVTERFMRVGEMLLARIVLVNVVPEP